MVSGRRSGVGGTWTLVAVSLVLVGVFFGLLSMPVPGVTTAGPSAHAPVVTISDHPIVRAAAHVAPASSAHPAATGFPRTVLVETFTGTWCPHCPVESQALFSIEHTYSDTFVGISELHITDQYTDTYGIDNARNSYYPVCGYPDVYFDGGHDVCGVYPGITDAQQEQIYYNAILNASAIPGNVSISQSAIVAAGNNVSVHANVTSAITGSYHAWTYLMEYIGVNDSTGHDITDVLRGAPINEAVDLTAGSTTAISGTLPIAPSWNSSRLSVVTFIQDVSTHVIENANLAPVASMVTGAVANTLTLGSGISTGITVTATNTSTGLPVAGATVSLSSDSGGTFTPSSGVTAANGTFATTFQAPTVTQQETVLVTVHATLAGYKSADSTLAFTVNPYTAPSAPTALVFAPAAGQVALLWTAPSTGSGGVTYHIYRSTSAAGPYTQIGTGTSLSLVDPAVSAQQIYYYQVSAQNLGGFSPNSTAVAAVPVISSSQGLPTTSGWWLVVASTAFNATGATSVPLHLAAGSYDYHYGPYDYAYVAPSADASGSITVGAAAVAFTANFAPNYALLTGTVYPATAQVMFNGQAVSVSGGAFTQEELAGSYPLVVSAPGFTTSHTTVVLTPGNSTNGLAIVLVAIPSGSSPAPAAGLSSVEMFALIGVAAVAVVALVAAVMWSRRRGGRSGGGGA